MDYSLPDSPVHEILQARILAWVTAQFSSVTQSCPTLCDPWTAARQASVSISNSWSSPKLMSIESVMPSSHLILSHRLLLLPPIPPSIRVFSNELVLHIRQPKYWNFSFNLSPSNEHPGLVFFRMDWLDLLAIQGTLKSLLQHHSSKASTLHPAACYLTHFCLSFSIYNIETSPVWEDHCKDSVN